MAELWLIDADGTRQRYLAWFSNHNDIIHPAVGPYGVLQAVVVVNRVQTMILDYEFSDVVGFIDFPIVDVRNIDLSDEHMAFDAAGDIWITEIEDVVNVINITDSPDVVETNPSLSPDGTRVAFEVAGWIVTTAADGSDLRRVVEGTDPAWSPQMEATAVTPSTWGQVKLEVNPR